MLLTAERDTLLRESDVLSEVLASKSISTERAGKVVVIGYGNVAKYVTAELVKRGIELGLIIRKKGIYQPQLGKIYEGTEDERDGYVPGERKGEWQDWKNFIEGIDTAFIATETAGQGEATRKYMDGLLKRNIRVITSEKAALASNPRFLRRNDGLLRYTATVGGGTRMLRLLTGYPPGKIESGSFVINGTFNAISSWMRQGMSLAEAIQRAVDLKYTETATNDLKRILEDESHDVKRKAAIILNLLLQQGCRLVRFTHTDQDIHFVNPSSEDDWRTKRCVLLISEKGDISVGFVAKGDELWLPDGVDNAAYLNGTEKTNLLVVGPGAGPAATAEVMMEDYLEDTSSRLVTV